MISINLGPAALGLTKAAFIAPGIETICAETELSSSIDAYSCVQSADKAMFNQPQQKRKTLVLAGCSLFQSIR